MDLAIFLNKVFISESQKINLNFDNNLYDFTFLKTSFFNKKQVIKLSLYGLFEGLVWCFFKLIKIVLYKVSYNRVS